MLRPSATPLHTSARPKPGANVARDIAPQSSSGKKERNSAATKLRILDSGEREFATRGFAGARLREIAVAAEVQPALIHHYFTDKKGLYRAVLDRALDPTSTESWTLLGSRRDLEGLLSGFIDLLLHFYAKHQNLLSILRHEALTGSSVLVELTKERTLPIIEALTRFLEECQAEGDVRADVRADEIIVSGMSMVVYPFVEAGMLEALVPSVALTDEASLDRRKRTIVELLLHGIRPAHPPKKAASAKPARKPPSKRAR